MHKYSWPRFWVEVVSGRLRIGTLGFKCKWVTNALIAFEKVTHLQDKMILLFSPLSVL